MCIMDMIYGCVDKIIVWFGCKMSWIVDVIVVLYRDFICVYIVFVSVFDNYIKGYY